MRRLWIVVAIVCCALALAGAASASVRGGVWSLVSTITSSPAADASTPSSPEPGPAGTEAGTAPSAPTVTDADDEDDAASTHGADVSKVARDKDAVGSKTLPNGKTITNHGMAVSAAAHEKGAPESDK